MKQWNKISIIAMVAVVIGMITLVPAMADDDDEDERKKKKKIDICHFDNENGKLVELSVPEKKAKGHVKNHVNDIIPAPENGCTDQDESDESVNMDEFMDDLTRHDDVITEITNSECSLGEVVTGFGPNGELLCSLDNTGEDNSFNIISRTETIELQPGDRLFQEYFCEPGEIILGGMIEMPFIDVPLSIDGSMITSGSDQSYDVVIETNRSSESVIVNVTYLCFVI